MFRWVTRAFGASHPGVGSDWLLSSLQQVFHAEWAAATPSAAMGQLGGAVTRVYRRDFRRRSIQRGFLVNAARMKVTVEFIAWEWSGTYSRAHLGPATMDSDHFGCSPKQ